MLGGLRSGGSLQTLPLIRCCSQTHNHTPARRRSPPDQVSKDHSFGLFCFHSKVYIQIFENVALLPWTQVPHLHTWENRVPQEGVNFEQNVDFPAEPERLVKIINNTLPPQRAPPQCASPTAQAGEPNPGLPPPKILASNCTIQVFPNPA